MKNGKQLKLRYTIHRCAWCKRELKNRVSVQQKAGAKCQQKQVLKGLRELAAYENS